MQISAEVKRHIEEAHWLGENVRIVSVEGPEQITDWWINRFVRLPIGWRVIFRTSETFSPQKESKQQ